MSIQDPQPGPIEVQLAQANEHQAEATGPSQGKAQKRSAAWTGFAGKTLWDWLNLLGAAVLIPLVVATATIWFSWQQNTTSLQLAQKQHDSDQTIALDQQRQTVLQIYEDNIKDLLLTKGLQTSKPGDAVRSVAHAETLAALRQLDGGRKGLLIQFLYEAHLIIRNADADLIISLSNADLSGATLIGASLENVDLGGAILDNANLSDADLNNANLSLAHLGKARLSQIRLSDAYLEDADLHGADLSMAYLNRDVLEKANLEKADLHGADLSGTDLYLAHIRGANLSGIIISNTTIMPTGPVHP